MRTAGFLFVVATLAAAAGALNLEYSTLNKEHVVNLDMKVTYKQDGDKDFQEYTHCSPDDKGCEQPHLNSDDGSVLKITYTAPKKPDVLTEFDGTPLSAPTKLQFKACYAKAYTTDRKWRKAKNEVSKDKRCGKDMGTVDYEEAEPIEFTLPTNTPTAQWFILALLKCPKQDDEGLVVCGYDSTGSGEKFLNTTQDNSSNELYYKTKVIDSRTTGLYVAVIVFSTASVSLLVGFFVFEQMTKKNK